VRPFFLPTPNPGATSDHRHRDAGAVVMWLWKTVWSNFEIADMDFWRGEAYTAFFEYLDRSGGFYYEVLSPPPNTPTLN
jgi:hypothetical protein